MASDENEKRLEKKKEVREVAVRRTKARVTRFTRGKFFLVVPEASRVKLFAPSLTLGGGGGSSSSGN